MASSTCSRLLRIHTFIDEHLVIWAIRRQYLNIAWRQNVPLKLIIEPQRLAVQKYRFPDWQR